MARTEPRAAGVLVIPERERVRLLVGALLDRELLDELEDEASGLLGRGFVDLVIDLRSVAFAATETAAAVAAIGRRARSCGARVSVLVAPAGAIRAAADVGLIGDLADEGKTVYFDWTR